MTAPIIVSDMDGTLTTSEMWRGVLAWVRAFHPSFAARRFVIVRLPLIVLARLGLVDKEVFRARWMRDFAGLLRGVTTAQLAEMGEWVVEQHLWPARRQAALDALAAAAHTARAADPASEVILATAAYQPVGDAFARRIGADVALATALEVKGGVATGRLAAPVQSGEQKAAAVRDRAAGRDVLVAFGDSAGDIPLLALAQRSVAVAPDSALRRAAVARGWEIVEAA